MATTKRCVQFFLVILILKCWGSFQKMIVSIATAQPVGLICYFTLKLL